MNVLELKNFLSNYPDDMEVVDCHNRPINYVVMYTIAVSKGLPNINKCKLSVANPFIPKDYSNLKKEEDKTPTLEELQARAQLEKQMLPEEVSV